MTHDSQIANHDDDWSPASDGDISWVAVAEDGTTTTGTGALTIPDPGTYRVRWKRPGRQSTTTLES